MWYRSRRRGSKMPSKTRAYLVHTAFAPRHDFFCRCDRCERVWQATKAYGTVNREIKNFVSRECWNG